MLPDDLRERHRRWLARHHLLDRPWFVLGSAPNPTIPAGIADRAAIICINNAGFTAARQGLPPANLTFRNRGKDWKMLRGHKVPLVLWVCNRKPRHIFFKRLTVPALLRSEIHTLPLELRRAIDLKVLGDGKPEDDETISKPSTGVFAVVYGLFVGVSEISLAGLSIDKSGYSHPATRARMMHSAEDRFALIRIAERYPSVSTTERVIHEATGIPLNRHS
jgi:hypothetical protein